MKEKMIESLQDTEQLGMRLATFMEPGMLLTLTGDLGAGKTTFTKAFGKGLGVKKTINSPTFTILKIYKGRLPLYHMDAYRLEGISQDLGFEEYFDSDGVCVVEWPHFIEEQLPKERLEIKITRLDEDRRLFTLIPVGSRYEKIVEEL